MGNLSSGFCQTTEIPQAEIVTPTEQKQPKVKSFQVISGPLGKSKIMQQSIIRSPAISEIQTPMRSQILRSQVSKIHDTCSTQRGSLTNKDFILPQQITKALMDLGEFIVDSKLVEIFKDCQKVETTEINEQGEFYLGQLSHGIKTGFGKILYFDQSYYEGFWFNNERHYNGRFVDKDGDAYIGEWFANQMHGAGKFVQRDGTVFDTMQGMHSQLNKRAKLIAKKPSQTYPDGRLYYGELCEGKKKGLGLFVWPDTTEYFGHYDDDKEEGFGIMKFEDGRKYEGQWSLGMMHGLGQFSWSNSQLYIGLYENDLKEGYGMFIWPNGQKYRGLFKHGVMNGIGRMVDIKGRILEAIWVNGKRAKKQIISHSQQTPIEIIKHVPIETFKETPIDPPISIIVQETPVGRLLDFGQNNLIHVEQEGSMNGVLDFKSSRSKSSVQQEHKSQKIKLEAQEERKSQIVEFEPQEERKSQTFKSGDIEDELKVQKTNRQLVKINNKQIKIKSQNSTLIDESKRLLFLNIDDFDEEKMGTEMKENSKRDHLVDFGLQSKYQGQQKTFLSKSMEPQLKNSSIAKSPVEKKELLIQFTVQSYNILSEQVDPIDIQSPNQQILQNIESENEQQNPDQLDPEQNDQPNLDELNLEQKKSNQNVQIIEMPDRNVDGESSINPIKQSIINQKKYQESDQD